MILVYRLLAWLFSRLADFLHNRPGLALAVMMAFGTMLCFVIAIGARSVVMEPTVPKISLTLAAVLGAWLVLASRRQR
jgi:hypothetical protein